MLIRALEPTEGHRTDAGALPGGAHRATSRAGRAALCAALGIGRELSGLDLCADGPLWLERGGAAPDIQVSTRIGLSRDQHRRLRFVERGSRFVSVPP